MGNIINMIVGDKTRGADILIDFEAAEPQTDEEREIHAAVAAILDKGPDLLDQLGSYPGCEDFIRAAITTPGEETESNAWKAVLPAVAQLKEFYDFSLELEKCFPQLLLALCKTDPNENLSSQQALAKQLADVFDFILRFDDAKMVNPAIQNDFSYYRRTLNRMKVQPGELDVPIRDELANRMSLFFAYPTPMMNIISETTVKFVEQDDSVAKENVTGALATMANVCQFMVQEKKFQSEKTNQFCLRAMTGAIILFDHLHATGAFHKKSPINIRACVTVLKGYQAEEGNNPSSGLLNALRFTTKHLNDPDTPTSIKQILA